MGIHGISVIGVFLIRICVFVSYRAGYDDLCSSQCDSASGLSDLSGFTVGTGCLFVVSADGHLYWTCHGGEISWAALWCFLAGVTY